MSMRYEPEYPEPSLISFTVLLQIITSVGLPMVGASRSVRTRMGRTSVAVKKDTP